MRCWGAPKLCLVVTYDSFGVLVGWVGPAPLSFAASLSNIFFKILTVSTRALSAFEGDQNGTRGQGGMCTGLGHPALLSVL